MSAPLSQTDYMTPMAAGSQAVDYQNDASTTQTTSGKKHSGQSSGEREPNNTQESGPNLYLLEERRSAGGSEIPDTQGMQMSYLCTPQTNISQIHTTPKANTATAPKPPIGRGPYKVRSLIARYNLLSLSSTHHQARLALTATSTIS